MSNFIRPRNRKPVQTLYNQDGIVIYMLPPNRITKMGSHGLVMFRTSNYGFSLDVKANDFAKRIVIKLFKKIGYNVEPVEHEFRTDFVLTDDKQKFTFMLKYGALPKQREDI